MVDRIAADPAFGMTREEILAELTPEHYVGRSPEQVEDFLENCVKPRLERLGQREKIQVEINL